MNKDRIDNTAQPMMKDSYVYEEATLVFSPLATPASRAVAGRRVLQTPTGEPFTLPSGAIIQSVRCVPYPADATGTYTGALTPGQRTALGTPTITLTRNTDVVSAVPGAGTDNPIKIFAVTEHGTPGQPPDTLGLVTNSLVIPLSLATIGAGTQYRVHGEDSVINNNVGGDETDALGMIRAQGRVFPHGPNGPDSDKVTNSATRIVGTSAVDIFYDIAVVVNYRLARASFSLAESFPPDRRFD
jgi:hypothetical protein